MNTKMKKIKTYFAVVLTGILALSSCTGKFEEYNRPGGNITKEMFNRDGHAVLSYIRQIEDEAFPEQENTWQMNIDLIGNYCGRYFTYTNPGWTNNFQRMSAPEGWAAYPYRDCLPKVSSAMREIEQLVDEDNPFYAWAQVVRAAVMLRLTDMYGPFPIANDGSYAAQEEVYAYLIAQLDHATDVLTPLVASNSALTMGDPELDRVYQGRMAPWLRFANSLKLRIAIRMRFADPATAQTIAESAVAAGVITDNADNCKTNYRPNGMYKTSVEWGDSRMCADLDSYMNGYGDPRLPKYFNPADKVGDRAIIGCPAAAIIGDKPTAQELYSSAKVTAETDGVWLTAAEMAFCRAEGALAGWNMGGSAQELYERGITLSFEQWGAGSADAYIADESSMPANYTNADGGYGSSAYTRASSVTIAWDEGASDEDKLEKIIVQKWIALFPEGQEAWNEIRRTGYPKVFALSPASVTGANVPNRVPFDPREKVDNRDAYLNAVSLLGGDDDYMTKLWWQR